MPSQSAVETLSSIDSIVVIHRFADRILFALGKDKRPVKACVVPADGNVSDADKSMAVFDAPRGCLPLSGRCLDGGPLLVSFVHEASHCPFVPFSESVLLPQIGCLPDAR